MDIRVNILQVIFNDANGESQVKVASTLDKTFKLLEACFEYATDMEGRRLFRKRK